MTKCSKDAQSNCDMQAADKKLAGAANRLHQEMRVRLHRNVSATILALGSGAMPS